MTEFWHKKLETKKKDFSGSKNQFIHWPVNLSADEQKVQITMQRSLSYERAPELLGY